MNSAKELHYKYKKYMYTVFLRKRQSFCIIYQEIHPDDATKTKRFEVCL